MFAFLRSSWLRALTRNIFGGRTFSGAPYRRSQWRPSVECLEERCTPTALPNFDIPVLSGSADVSISMKADAVTVRPGDNLTYSVTLQNNGPDAVSGVVVNQIYSDMLTGLTIELVSGSGTYSSAPLLMAGTLYDTVSLASGSSVIYTVSGTVSASMADQAAQRILSSAATLLTPGVLDTNPLNNIDVDADVLVLSATDGTGVFTNSGQAIGSDEGNVAVALGDLDGDGDLDAVVANILTSNKVLLNNGQGSFSDSGQSLSNSFTTDVALGDIDRDGDLDIVFAGLGTSAWINNGAGVFTAAAGAFDITNTFAVALADLDGEGSLDAFFITDDSGGRIFWNNGDGRFNNSFQDFSDDLSRTVALGDVDNDGDADAAIASYYLDTNSFNKVWKNDGVGLFSNSGQNLGAFLTAAVVLGDLDSDRDLDIIFGDKNTNHVWLNDGMGNFTDNGQTFGVNQDEPSLGLGDLNGDGDLDAVVASEDGEAKVYLNNGQGVFASNGFSFGAAEWEDVALGDLDGDGDLDAFFALIAEKSRVYFNNNSTLTLDITASSAMTNASPITFTFQFGAAVTGFTASDVTITNGTAGTFTAVDGDTYTLQVTPTADGTVSVSVAANVAFDATNGGNRSASASVTSDRTAPTVSITPNGSMASKSPLSFRFAFSETVTGFTLDDITVTNGTKRSLTFSGSSYTLLVTPIEGVVTVSLSADAVQDAAGNTNLGQSAFVTYDATAPTLVITPNNTETGNSTIVFTFQFSEAVIGFDTHGISIENGTLGTVTTVDADTRTVTVTATDAGMVTIQADRVARDAANNTVPFTSASVKYIPAPTPIGPNGTIAAADGYDRPRFEWSDVVSADHYYLYVIDLTTGKAVINNPNVRNTSFMPDQANALTPGHSYVWYVGANNADGSINSYLPAGQQFALAALPAPTQTGPSGVMAPAAGYDRPTFTWNAVAGADHYYLYVVNQTTGQAVINEPTLGGTTYTPSAQQALTPGHSYAWYVGAISTNGQINSYLPAGQTFSLAGLPAPMQNGPSFVVNPAAGYDRPTFSWQAAPGADRYYLRVVDLTTQTVVIDNPNVNGTSFTPGASQALTPGHNHVWYVGAISTNGQVINYARSGQQFVLVALPAPVQNGPSGTVPAAAGYDRPTFSWQAAPGADHYYLYVIDQTTQTVAINQPNVHGTSFTPSVSEALTPGHSYTWYVGAISTNGQVNRYFPGGRSFSLAALPAPTQNGPTGTIAAAVGYDRPTFSWNAVAGADHYYLYVVDAPTGKAVIDNPNVNGTSFTPSASQALTPGHSYVWYVGAISMDGQVNSYLPGGQQFGVAPLPAPTQTGPSGVIAAADGYDRPTFAWNAVAGADHYYVYVIDLTTQTVAINQPNVNATSFRPSDSEALTPGHSYVWYVGAISTNGQINSYQPTGQSFSLAALPAPTQNGPSDVLAPAAGYDRPTFSWNAVAGADHYYLYVIDLTTLTVVLDQPTIHATIFTPSAMQALTPGHTYVWYVGAISTNGRVNSYLPGGRRFTLAV